jgi:hypothetical protein
MTGKQNRFYGIIQTETETEEDLEKDGMSM